MESKFPEPMNRGEPIPPHFGMEANCQLQDTVSKYMQENMKLNQQIATMEDFIREANQETTKDMKKYLETIELLDMDFKETSEALDKAHDKIQYDLEEMKGLIAKNEETEEENARLKAQEKVLRKKVKNLENELKELDELPEESDVEDSSVWVFWKNGMHDKNEKKVKYLHRALKEAYADKIQSQRKLATMTFELKKSRDFIHKQKSIISDLELHVKKDTREDASENIQDLQKTESEGAVSVKSDPALTISKQKEIEKLEKQITDLREKNIHLEKNSQTLSEVLEFERRKNLEKGADKKFQEVQASVEEKENTIKELERKNELFNLRVEELEQLKGNADNSEFEVHKMREEIDNILLENEKLKFHIAEQENALQRRSMEIEEMKSLPDAAAEREMLQIKTEELQNSYYYKVEENIALNKQLNELNETVDSLSTEREELSQRLAECLKSGNGVCCHAAVFGRISQELLELQNKLNHYTRDMPEVESWYGDMETEVFGEQAEVDAVSVPDSELTTTTWDTTDAGVCQDFLTGQEERSKIKQRIKRTFKNIESSLPSVYEQEQHMPSTEPENADPSGKKGNLKVYPSRYDRVSRKSEEFQKKWRILTQKRTTVLEDHNISNLQRLMKKLKAQINSITNHVDVIEFEKDDLELELNRLKSSETHHYKNNNELFEENKCSKVELNSAHERIKQLTIEKQNLEERIEQLMRATNEASANFGKQLEECRKQKKEINDMRTQLEDFRKQNKEMSDIKTQLQECRKQNKERSDTKADNRSTVLCDQINGRKSGQENNSCSTNIQKEKEPVHNELGMKQTHKKVADIVNLLERQQAFSRQRPQPSNNTTLSRRNSFTATSNITRSQGKLAHLQGWRDKWADGEAI